VSKKEGILLPNLLQGSKSTFSWESFLSFFAFKVGMRDTQISALGGWATVSEGFVRLLCRAKKPLEDGAPAWGASKHPCATSWPGTFDTGQPHATGQGSTAN